VLIFVTAVIVVVVVMMMMMMMYLFAPAVVAVVYNAPAQGRDIMSHSQISHRPNKLE
jgi:hypothetical protein